MKPKYIKQLQTQSRKLGAQQIHRHIIAVESTTDPDVNYRVTIRFEPDNKVYAHCTCTWAEHQGIACSHVMAALEYMAAMKQRTLSFWRNREDAERQKHRMFRLVGNKGGGSVWITSRTA